MPKKSFKFGKSKSGGKSTSEESDEDTMTSNPMVGKEKGVEMVDNPGLHPSEDEKAKAINTQLSLTRTSGPKQAAAPPTEDPESHRHLKSMVVRDSMVPQLWLQEKLRLYCAWTLKGAPKAQVEKAAIHFESTLDCIFNVNNAVITKTLANITQHVKEARVMSVTEALVRLQTAAVAYDIPNEDLEDACRVIVVGSRYPVMTCLKLANLFKGLCVSHMMDEQRYREIQHYMTDTGSDLFKALPNDRLGALLLEQENSMGENALKVALDSNNGRFLSSNRVSRITTSMWKRPNFLRCTLDEDHDLSLLTLDVWVLLLLRPNEFLRLPVGKFLAQVVLDVVLLTIYTMLVLSRKEMVKEPSLLEYLLLFYCVGFSVRTISLVRQIKDNLPNLPKTLHQISSCKRCFGDFMNNGWRVLDTLITLIFCISIFARLSNPSEITLYSLCISMNAILLWVRVCHVVQLHPGFGPLVRIGTRMTGDICNFVFIMILLMMGFSGAFWFCLAAPPILTHTPYEGTLWPAPGFTSYISVMKRLFQGMLGEFDYSGWFDPIDPDYAFVHSWATFLLTCFLVMGTTVLLNLIVAMLSETFASVADNSTAEYMTMRTQIIHELDCQSGELPPPLNLIVGVLASPFWCYESLQGLSSKKKTAWCCYCHNVKHERSGKQDAKLRDTILREHAHALSKHGNTEQHHFVKTVLSDMTRICEHCYRKRPSQKVHIAQIYRERLSVLVFLLTFYIPMVVFLLPIVLIGNCRKRMGAQLIHANRKKATARRVIQRQSMKGPTTFLKTEERNRLYRRDFASRSTFIAETLKKEVHTKEDVFFELDRCEMDVRNLRYGASKS